MSRTGYDVDSRLDERLWEFWIGGSRPPSRRPKNWAAIVDGDENNQVALAGLITLPEISRAEGPRRKAPKSDPPISLRLGTAGGARSRAEQLRGWRSSSCHP